MERQSLQFKVYSDRDCIVISQEDPGQSEDNTVWIHPDQTDLLIKWINEVKAKLEKK